MHHALSTERRVVAVVQARMGSKRFPGKVLADLGGYPVLEWVVGAAQRVVGVDSVVVATTTNDEDAAIEAWCHSTGTEVFRGHPVDVLERYADCARQSSATHVVRLTADCPLLDAEVVSKVLSRGLETGADYFCLAGDFPDGLDCEGFTVEALNIAHASATRPSEREHVTPYLKDLANNFRVEEVVLFHSLSDVRLTVDYPADLALLQQIVGTIGLPQREITTEEVLGVLERNPQLSQVNSHIPRNEGYARSLERESPSG